MTRLPLRSVCLGLLTLVLLACASDVPVVPDPSPPLALRTLVARLPFLMPLLAGASTSPARPRHDGGFLVEGQPLATTPPSPGRSAFSVLGKPMKATLGERASDPLQVETTGAGMLNIRRKGASGSTGRVDQGVVLYADAFEGADAVVVSKDSGVEELVVARGREAEVVYEVDLPAGWKLVEHGGLGLVEVKDAGGAARLRVEARKAWDGKGREVPLGVSVRGREILLKARGEEGPVVIDPVFAGTGSMFSARISHTATVLADGRVLLAGGLNGGSQSIDTAEVYDPKTGTFSLTSSLMKGARLFHTATLLADGRVLLAGGQGSNGSSTGTAEVFDPKTGTFSPTASKMKGARSFHTATLLADGRVLLAGGQDPNFSVLDTAEVYDPKTDTFSLTSSPMKGARLVHTATLLADGRVLLAGGFGPDYSALDTAKLFDPKTDTFSPISLKMTEPRSSHTVTLLADGRVLLTGGGEQHGGGV
jgi:hypothetical protein